MTFTRLALSIAAGVFAFALPATAATITFESAAGFNSSVPASFTDGAFTLTYTPAAGGFASVTNAPNGGCGPPCAVNGTNIFQSFNFGSLTVTLTGGGLFSLTAFDAAQTFTTLNRSLALTVSAIGTGGPVQQQFTTAPGGADTFSTYLASGAFASISSLTFQGGPQYPEVEFELDNIVLNGAVAGVPEPATWALMLLGFGAIGSVLRRRQVQTRVRFAI